MTDAITSVRSTTQPKTIYLKDYKPPTFWIDEIYLDVDLQEEVTLVSSRLRIRRNTHSLDRKKILTLNGRALTLVSIKLNGTLLPTTQYHVDDEYLTVQEVPDDCEIDIVVKIFPQKNTALSGLYRSGSTYCTQCEAEGFRRITYYQDHPDVLARFTTKITADATRYPTLLSNGNLIDSGKLENGRHWVKWEDPFKKPSYLFALVAGDFDLLEDTFTTQSGNEVALKVFVEKGFGNQSSYAMFSLKEAMCWDEKSFGREYDLDIFMIVAISDFNMGAMENKGLNVFNTKYILAKPETATDDDYIHILSVVGHEYFHNWSGNRVTCRDWFQLSLKEGLTIFRDQLFTEDLISKKVMRIRDVNRLRESQFPEDAGPLAHPVRPDAYLEINNFYTATIYEKGAEVLRMLRTMLGTDTFRKAMDMYFARHDGQAVTIEEFVVAMEDVSGMDLSQFRRWYDQAGTPLVTSTGVYHAEKQTFTMQFRQHTPKTPGQRLKLPQDIPIRMGFIDSSGKSLPIQINGQNEADEIVLHLKDESMTVEFTHLTSKPIPSLLRDFSAPVKLNYPYSENDLICLFKHDRDAFNQWEAGQNYALSCLLALINCHQQSKNLSSPETIIEMYRYTLTVNQADPFFLSEQLVLPSEKYIGEQMDVVDVDAIYHAREFVITEIASKLESNFQKLYQQLKEDPATYQFDINKIGSRQLKNRCLMFMTQLNHNIEIAHEQFKSALRFNMTDTQAALNCLANSETYYREQALSEFYEEWKNDPLVVDKWFAIQAASKLPTTLKHVMALTSHPAFDIKNPNKVYALVGTFAYRNSINFHTRSGDGYEFLREMVIRLDALNPQIAARMVNPLTSWKRYDKERQALMCKQLELLLKNKKLSTDVYELVTKSLEES